MARNHKAEYARRKAAGIAKGLTVEQARGHKPREHQTRKEHAVAAGRLTEDELTWLRRIERRNPSSDIMANAAAAFRRASPEQRQEIITTQRKRQRSREYARISAPNFQDPYRALKLTSRSGLR